MANDVFEPQAGAKLDVTVGRAEAANICLDLPREVPGEVVFPRIAKFARESRRDRGIRKRAAYEVRKTRYAEHRKHNAGLIDCSQTHLPDVYANFLFGLRCPEGDMQTA